VALSLKNVPEQVDSNTEINLIDDLIKRGGGEAEPLNLDDWPILLLLKGLSVSTVKFTTDNTEIIQNWADRMAEYQALFLEDPAYLVPSEREWNEKDPTTGEFAVECIFHKKKELKQKQKIVKPLFFVPPMEAPVALDPQSADKFLQEVENQHPQEILQRVQGILKEYVSSSPSIDNQLMSYLIGDIIVIALENDLLLKAEQLAEEYEESLVHIWQDNDRFKQLLASYNPKAHEVSLWASIFKSYKLKGLVESLSFLITSEASAQIVQLLSFRAQISSNEMIELCFESPPVASNDSSAVVSPSLERKTLHAATKISQRKYSKERKRPNRNVA